MNARGEYPEVRILLRLIEGVGMLQVLDDRLPNADAQWQQAFGGELNARGWYDVISKLTAMRLVIGNSGHHHVLWNLTPLGLKVANGIRNHYPSVFLSHSHHDNEFCRRLWQDLERAGFPTFFDVNDISGGDSVPDKINQGLASSGFAISVWSTNSKLSTWVKMEVNAAINLEAENRLKLLVIRLDSTPLSPLLASKRYINFATHSYEDAFQELIQSLQAGL